MRVNGSTARVLHYRNLTVLSAAPNCRLQKLYGRQLCGVCQLTCPDQAIHWIEEEPYELHKVAIEY